MSRSQADIVIVGGSLSGGLAALALVQALPDLQVRLVEAGKKLGGNHRWSWFASDISPAAHELLAQFAPVSWHGGYDVRFPAYSRHLNTEYYSLSSADFHDVLERKLPEGTVISGGGRCAVDAGGVVLADGSRLAADIMIDCRGMESSDMLEGGWQVFYGRHMRTCRPHGIERPIIMDASVRQEGGYRFVYVLPLGAKDLFVEDTYYQDTPVVDEDLLGLRIERYCRHSGWQGEIIHSETGVLPVITGGDFRAWQDTLTIPGVSRLGVRGGFTHPLTSYSVPFAAENAVAVAAHQPMQRESLYEMTSTRAAEHWKATSFYRKLGKMLFQAAEPEKRYRVFSRFYRLPRPLIERFYAARSTPRDRLRILSGRPPVPITKAISALSRPGEALTLGAERL